MVVNLYSFLPDELCETINQKVKIQKYRANQIFEWLYKEIYSFADMNNLPLDLRDNLEQNFTFPQMKILNRQISIDGTTKFLMKCPFDENLLEVVLMKYKFGLSLCISTQVGCAMQCNFCASGKHGLTRNLTAGEMILEILTIQNEIHERISNIVLMGMGEPLANFEETMKFLEIVHHRKGLNIGYRHITLSTCGIVPKIKKLAEFQLPITLAISLHAATDELRNQIMPINIKYPLHDLIEACKYYHNMTKRRITFEYAIIEGINDTIQDAKNLINLIKEIQCHVNIIPINPAVNNYVQPSKENVNKFLQYLEEHNIACTIRREMGRDIDAACGQLRNRHLLSKDEK